MIVSDFVSVEAADNVCLASKFFVESVAAELKAGGKVQLVGFGTFEVRERAARDGINPQTKEAIKIAASKNPVFKAGAALKNAVK